MAAQAVSPSNRTDDITYAGYSRFELELEFVQCLANPHYLNYLATQKFYADPAFVAYLEYLQYFKQPEYARFLSYPAPTLHSLELLQQEQFRKDILMPDLVARLIAGGAKASTEGR